MPHARVLIEFAEALLGNSSAQLSRAREAVAQAVGEAGLVDAAAVAANFNSIDRVADATGVPLEDEKTIATEDLRDTLGINKFTEGRND